MSIELKFDGYWRLPPPNVAAFSGIYCVYAWSEAPRLLYIGGSKNVRDRVANHERQSDWEQAADGDDLCFSAAVVSAADREHAEAAMIYEHRPPCNEEYREEFPFPDITIIVTGEKEGLRGLFLASED